MTIAFLGTGTMGAPMARNLLAAGYEVRVWNRTRAKADPLAADGAVVATEPAEAADGADILITMLLDGAATADAASSAAAGLADGAIWVQMGTIGLGGLADAAGVARDHGIDLVDAPVLGTLAPARQGTLTILAAGAARLHDRVQPLFDAVGERTLWLGEDAEQGNGTRLKLAVNAWVVALANATGESMAIASALGINPQSFLDAIKGSGTDSPYAHLKGAAILNNDFSPHFRLDAALKDSDLIAEAVGDRLRLDVAAAVRERFRRAAANGHGAEDMTAAYFASFPDV